MDAIEIANLAIAILFLLSLIFLVLFLKYKRREDCMHRELEENGICMQISDKKIEELKMEMGERFDFIKEFSQLYYMNCDNFYMHRDSLAKAMEQFAERKGIGSLCRDIVTVSNLCMGGAIDALSTQFGLSLAETRVCCFLYWGFKWQQTCTLEGISENAYFIKCSRIRRKLGLTKDEDIPTFINSFMRSFAQL